MQPEICKVLLLKDGKNRKHCYKKYKNSAMLFRKKVSDSRAFSYRLIIVGQIMSAF